MAKETVTPAPAETKAEKKPEKKAPAESVYTVSELAGNARSVFGTMQECVVAALKTDGKAEYTVSEAKEIVSKFLQKEVNGKSVQHQSDGKRNAEVQPTDAADNSNNDIHTGETRCGRSSWWRSSAVMVSRGRLGRVCYPDKSKPKDKSA